MKPATRNRLIVAVVLVLALLIGYQQFVSPFPVLPEAREALTPDDQVEVSSEPYLVFRPAAAEPRAGLVFYSGARVEPTAYAPFGRALAAQGYLVAIPKLPFNFAFLGVSTANDVLVDFPEVDTWVVGGHSLGGAMAASYADRTERIDGLLLVAAFPGSSLDMSNRSLHTTVVYGNRDELATPDEVLEAADRLPEDAEFVLVPGANHAQFGWYGTQANDGQADLGRRDQQAEMVRAAAALLRTADG